MKYRFTLIGTLILVMTAFVLSSCHKKLELATVLVVDPVRHYYPVIQGDMMEIKYELENTSENPLFIHEIQTTCGCIVPKSELPIVVLPHKTGSVNVTFNTIKNTGYVDHFIYCYGNFRDTTCIELEFDTNVVPSADYIRDYEELWYEQNALDRKFKGQDGKNYYTDKGTNT